MTSKTTFVRLAAAPLLIVCTLALAPAALAQQPGRPMPLPAVIAAAPQDQPPDRPAPARPESQAQNGNQNQPPLNQLNDDIRLRRRLAPEGKVTLAFSDVPVDEKIVAFIAESTGKVVMPKNLQALKVKKITLLNDEPVERSLALDLLFAALRLNDVGIVETEDVIIIDLIENLRNRDVPVYNADETIMDMFETGNFIVKIFKLKETSAENVSDGLQENLPDYASLSVDVNSNQLIFRGPIGYAQHLQKLIQELDQKHVKIKTETFRLAYADAQLVSDQIVELFQESGTAPRTPQNVNRGRTDPNQPRPGAAGAPGAASLGNVLGEPGPTVELRVSVNVQRNSVTVSAEPQKIEAISKLIHEQWDLPRAQETAKVYVLKSTDPLKVRDLLLNLVGNGAPSSGGQGGRTQAPRGVPQAQGGGGGSGVSEVIGDIYKIEAYPEQNSIVVLSKTAEALDYLDSIIEAIDQPSNIGLPMVIELKHANAVNLAEELNILLAEAGSGTGLIRPDTGLSGGAGGLGDAGGSTTTGAGGGAGFGQDIGGRTMEAGTEMQFPWQTGQPRTDQSPETPLIGKVRIMPVLRQNALAVLAPPSYRDSVLEMIQELDRPGRQVLISAVIAEVELTDLLALGLRFGSGVTPGTTDNTFFGSIGIEGTQDDVLDGLFDTSVLDASMDVNLVLEALRRKTNVRILQEPRVFTADNQEAIFFDGQDVPFITNSTTTDIAGVTQGFDYRQVGVFLNVRPRITVERDIDMEINLELSDLTGETLFGGAIVNRRQTTTQIIVKNNQTIVISGILKDTESQTVRGIPLLEDIPLLGELFRSRENSTTTSELVAFITPVVVDNPSENEENFNRDDRMRLQDLSRPLTEQLKDKNRTPVRDKIIGPKALEPSESSEPAAGAAPAGASVRANPAADPAIAPPAGTAQRPKPLNPPAPAPNTRPQPASNEREEPVDIDDTGGGR